MQVKLLSVLIDPRPERRDELIGDLVQHGIGLNYLTMTNDGAYTVFKGLVPNAEEALLALQKEGYTAFLKDILAVGSVQGYASLLQALQVLEEKGMVAEQCSWLFSPAVGPFLLLVVKDLPVAQAALQEAGYYMLNEDKLCQ